MIYIGSTGRLYGQHWTADLKVQTSERAVNDGGWHHVALVKAQNIQHLYVDGALAGSSSVTIETAGLASCQAGSGDTSLWPDGPEGGCRSMARSTALASRCAPGAQRRSPTTGGGDPMSLVYVGSLK